MAPKAKQASTGGTAKVADITPTDAHNAANVIKANQKMDTIWSAHKKFDDPQRVDPDCIGISIYNRKPNYAYAHATLGKSVMEDGYDPDRAGIGMLIDFGDDHELLDQLIKHNMTTKSDVGDLLPTIMADKLRYDPLGSQHLSLVLRLIKNQCTSPITGQTFHIKDDSKLNVEITTGHRYWILKPSILKNDAEWIAQYKNSSQNTDIFFSFGELMRQVQALVKVEKQRGTEIKSSNVVAAFAKQSLVKVKPESVLDMSKWICGMGIDSLVDEYLYEVNMAINPREKTVSTRWYAEQNGALPPKFGLMRLAVALVHLFGENVLEQSRPQDICFKSLSTFLIIFPHPPPAHTHARAFWHSIRPPNSPNAQAPKRLLKHFSSPTFVAPFNRARLHSWGPTLTS